MKNSLEIKGGQRPFRGLYEHNIQVDSFSKASPIYILSHFHKDHCLGIDNLQKTGGFVIYCSQVTKELLMLQYTKLRENSFVSLLEGTAVSIKGTKVKVTCWDANHCPGSLILLFEIDKTERILYTGDFRLELEAYRESDVDQMVMDLQKCDKLYLDTTFGDHYFHDIPTLKGTIDLVTNLIRDKRPKNGKVFMCPEILGSEVMIRDLCNHLKIMFYIDDKVKETRVAQLKHLIPECLTTDSTNPFIMTTKSNIKGMGQSTPLDQLLIVANSQWSKHEFASSYGNTLKQDVKLIDCVWHVLYSMHASLSELRYFVEKVGAKKIVSNVHIEYDYEVLKSKKRVFDHTPTPSPTGSTGKVWNLGGSDDSDPLFDDLE